MNVLAALLLLFGTNFLVGTSYVAARADRSTSLTYSHNGQASYREHGRSLGDFDINVTLLKGHRQSQSDL